VIVDEMPPWIIRGFAFLMGALWGSFFNVAIYRWPRQMSVVSPRSACTHCGTPIPGSRNIPLVTYLVQRGKTACCGKRLSPRYFFVELLSAVLAVAMAERYVLRADGSSSLAEVAIIAAIFFAFVGGLLVASFIDLEWMEIPDEVTVFGTALGLATVSLRGPDVDAVDMAIGAGAGYLLVQVVLVWSWERLTGRVGMGEGDSGLLMFVGAFLGWQGALFALVAGAFQGIVASIVLYAAGRRVKTAHDPAPPPEDDTREPPPAPFEMTDGTKVELSDGGKKLTVKDAHGRLVWAHEHVEEEQGFMRRPIPFGPFIALAALEFLFFGEQLVAYYLSLFE
jgi:leader peptidase (prepilin peptidase)/N-methyltransferase